MRNGEQRDALILARLVDLALDVDRHGASALIEQRKPRPAGKQTVE